jgi:ABC-type cobalamin/Fe3+-siderophores transport system ATPase subunit
MLIARNIHVAYGTRTALDGVNLSIFSGELVVLLGPNGSGKSTLVKSVLGTVPATGTIEWFGKRLRSWNRRKLARKVAYLPQTPGSEPGQTVLDVLRLGRAPYWSVFGVESAADDAAVQRVARELEMTDWFDRPVDTLSGGQRQRVYIGRCLVQDPAAILLDEPTAHLDLRHQLELCIRLKNFTREKQIGVLLVLHDLNLAAHVADRIVLLSGARVAAIGAPNEVMTPDIISKVYELPMRSASAEGDRPVLFPAAYGSDDLAAASVEPVNGLMNRSSTSNSLS